MHTSAWGWAGRWEQTGIEGLERKEEETKKGPVSQRKEEEEPGRRRRQPRISETEGKEALKFGWR